MNGENVATQEGVIIIQKDGEPIAMLRKNGTVQWFSLKPMGWSDFAELLEVNIVQSSH